MEAAIATRRPSERRIATWQALREFESIRLHVEDRSYMEEAMFVNMVRARRLRRTKIDAIDELSRPPAGAVAIVELLARVITWKDSTGRQFSGLRVPQRALAWAADCSYAQVPIALKWLEARRLADHVRTFEPNHVRDNAECCKLVEPGDMLRRLIRIREARIRRGRRARLQGLKNCEATASSGSASLKHSQKSERRRADAVLRHVVDNLRQLDRLAKEERPRRRARVAEQVQVPEAPRVEPATAPPSVNAAKSVANAHQLDGETRKSAEPAAPTLAAEIAQAALKALHAITSHRRPDPAELAERMRLLDLAARAEELTPEVALTPRPRRPRGDGGGGT